MGAYSDVVETIERAKDTMTVRRVFGDPVEKDGVTIVPAARVQGGAGGGGGEGPEGQGSGMGTGFGVNARPVGAFVIKGEDVQWRRAVDVLEELGDEEGLSDAHRFASATALILGRATETLSEAELALVYSLRSGASVDLSALVGRVTVALILGSTPAGAGLDRVERLVDQVAGNREAEAEAIGCVAWFLALLGRADEARAAARQAQAVFEDLGMRWSTSLGAFGNWV